MSSARQSEQHRPVGRRRVRTVDHPSRNRSRARRALTLVTALVLPMVLVTNSEAVTRISVTNPNGLTAAGPVNSDHGFPAYYQDSAGRRIEPCLDGDNPLCGFLPGDIPNPDLPISFPDNFPEEFFYQLVGGDLTLPGGGKAVLTLGLEAAFANGVEQGEQVVFARTRVTVKGGPRNTTLTFKHPFGELTIDTDATGAGRIVQDISPAVGNFTAALKGNFGPFLTWDPTVAPSAPAGYAGDPGQTHAVVGGKNGYNKFAVVDLAGATLAETASLTVSGKIATNTGVIGDYAAINTTSGTSYLDVFATSGGDQLQVDGVLGQYVTTPMTNDPGSPRHYARVALLNDAAPTSVKVTNLGDKPLSSATIKLPDVTITEASFDGIALHVSARSASYPLNVVGFGDLPNANGASFALHAPPAVVTVRSATGAPVTFPVTVTGGVATDPGLPPVAPAPDGPPVIDKTPDNPTATLAPAPVAVIAAPTPVLPGAVATLDASGSTGSAATFSWVQTGGPKVALSNVTAAKPTLTVPYFTTTSAAAPAAPVTLTYKVTVTETGTGSDTPARTSEKSVDVAVKADVVAIAAGARHRIGTELRIDGTALVDGVAFSGTPSSSVVIWNNSNPAAAVKLGVSAVDTLGNWTLRLKPGPSIQVTSILVQSTRGGSATSAVTNR